MSAALAISADFDNAPFAANDNVPLWYNMPLGYNFAHLRVSNVITLYPRSAPDKALPEPCLNGPALGAHPPLSQGRARVYDASGALVYTEHKGFSSRGDRYTEYLRAGGHNIGRFRYTGSSPNFIVEHSDHLGSSVAMTSNHGGLVNRQIYSPFGLTLDGNDPADLRNEAGFTGHIRDSATGLSYMQARYYDPVIGRFLSVDPVGFLDTGNPAMFNRYAYALNEPINMFDPDGRRPVSLDLLKFQRLAITVANNPRQAAGVVADFIPIVGDVKGAKEFAQNPTVLGGAAVVVGIVPIVGDVAGKGLKALDKGSDAARLADDALVVRGGSNTADRFANGSGVTTNADGTLNGVSVNSAPDATVSELSQGIPHNQVGVTTVGDVRAAGGDITPSPTPNNPNHCTMCGVTPQQAEDLFNPTIRNPNN